MNIYLDEHYYAHSDQAIIGYVGENNSRKIIFHNHTISGADLYKLQIEYSDKVSYQLEISQGECIIPASVLRMAEVISCQVLALKTENGIYSYVKKSNVFYLTIRSALSDEPAPVPTYEQAVQALDKVLESEEKCSSFAQQAKSSAESVSDSAALIDRTALYLGEIMLMPATKFLLFKTNAGQFDMTVVGFTNPIWQYGDEKIYDSNGRFTIKNSGDIVKLSWDNAVSTRLTVNAGGRTQAIFALSDLYGKITDVVNVSNSNISGSLYDVRELVNAFYCSNTAVTGNLADLKGTLIGELYCTNTAVYGIYTPTSAVPTATSFTKTAVSTEDMDSTLNAYAAAAAALNKINGTFSASSMTRTSQSDNALSTLVGLGWTVSGLTKVEG